MKIVHVCQYGPGTAEHILTTGRAEACTDLCHNVDMIVQGWKGVRWWNLWPSALWNCRRLIGANQVYIQKALPVGLFFAIMARILAPRATIVGIADDWEGVGGFASLRSRESVLRKVLVTASEELFSVVCHRLWCVSAILYDRWLHMEPILMPNGGPLPTVSPKPGREAGRSRTIGYIGTIKTQAQSDWLTRWAISAHMHTEMPFLIIGDWPGAPDWVRVTTALSHDSAMKVLEKLDFGLIPLAVDGIDGTIDQSRSSTKLFEYWSRGVIPVVSDVGEPARLITHMRNGIIIDDTTTARRLDEITETAMEIMRKNCYNSADMYCHTVIMTRVIGIVSKKRDSL